MKNVYKFLSLMLFLFLNQGLVLGTIIQPVERNVGKLRISIDPRMELLSIIQLISNYPQINRNIPYSKEILSYFESFSSEEAVKLTESLQQNYGFSYDAPVAFMLYLSQPPGLESQMTFSDYLLGRSGEGDNLEEYRKSIKQFAEISDFESFWNNKMPFYNKILDMTVAEIEGKDLIKVMEDYFNETKGSYNIILAPAFRGGYGCRIPDANGKDKIYACLSTTNIKDDIPYLYKINLYYYVWHEFGHSFVNPLTEKYADRVANSDKLLEPIKDEMSRQAYPQWNICVNEHIIRAIHVRLMELHFDSQQSKALLANDKSRRFIYIEPLIEKLIEFEKQRDENHITFSEFYPELINVLDSLQTIEYWKQVKMDFKGPIHIVSQEEKLAIIYPTQDTDNNVLKIVQDYIFQAFDVFFNSMGGKGIILADTTALTTDLSEYGILTYGTIESNLFSKQYVSLFPFRIENQTIFADREYTDKDIKFVSCVPNPFNPEKGMLILTALSNKAIQDINDIDDGSKDKVLFHNKNAIISSGFYNKNGKWKF